MSEKKTLVIGLDCVPPEIIFKRFRNKMPNISNLIEKSVHGELESSIPPSSTNAWSSMAMGRNSHSIGIYDYIHRVKRSYTDVGVINSNFSYDCLWDILSERGKKVVVYNVPMTYPPREVNGVMISDVGFTPSEKSDFTYPKSLKEEIEKKVGKYIIKIPDARKLKKDELLKEIFRITEKRFDVFDYLLEKKEWNFFIGVIYATDALMHNFWRYLDTEHKKYEDDKEMLNKIGDYFEYIDKRVGKIISGVDENTLVLLMSDHGAKRMDGRINLNEWFIRQGYLIMNSKPTEEVPIFMADVKWEKTKAFAYGAYYASVFINLDGRDPNGAVKSGREYRKLKKELIAKLKGIKDENGKKMKTQVFEIPESENSPDLIVYFDDLHWGTNSSIPHDTLYSWATQKGPDDAVHSQKGFFIFHQKNMKKNSNLGTKKIVDIAPTILKNMNMKIPKEMEGKIIDF